jgi:hypothetical protein
VVFRVRRGIRGGATKVWCRLIQIQANGPVSTNTVFAVESMNIVSAAESIINILVI